jgi:hypothetical protein
MTKLPDFLPGSFYLVEFADLRRPQVVFAIGRWPTKKSSPAPSRSSSMWRGKRPRRESASASQDRSRWTVIRAGGSSSIRRSGRVSQVVRKGRLELVVPPRSGVLGFRLIRHLNGSRPVGANYADSAKRRPGVLGPICFPPGIERSCGRASGEALRSRRERRKWRRGAARAPRPVIMVPHYGDGGRSPAWRSWAGALVEWRRRA